MIQKELFFKPIINFSTFVVKETLGYTKSYFTWKGRDITLINNESFLSQNNWEHNLEILSKITPASSTASLMTKKIYQWLPDNSLLAEGCTNLKDQFDQLSSESYAKWLTHGIAAGITLVFLKAMQVNLNCLDQYEIINEEHMRECMINYGQFLSQPGRIAQVVVASGAWALIGFLNQTLGDFGLRGYITQQSLTKDLSKIFSRTADSARQAFWNAVDRGDQKVAQEIYEKAKQIKVLLPYMKKTISRELTISDTAFAKMMRPFDIFIEDVQGYEQQKAALVDSASAPVEEKLSQVETTSKISNGNVTVGGT